MIKKLLSQVDGCFHLAGLVGIERSRQEWLTTNQVNLVGTINIFNSASYLLHEHNKVVPIIYASSCSVYGQTSSLPLSESILTYPLSASYGNPTKARQEGISANYSLEEGLQKYLEYVLQIKNKR